MGRKPCRVGNWNGLEGRFAANGSEGRAGKASDVAGCGEESQGQSQDLINGHVQTSFVQVKPVLERGAMYKSH